MGFCQACIATRGCAWFDAILRMGVGVKEAFALLIPKFRSLHCYLISVETYLALPCSLNDVKYINNLHISKYLFFFNHYHHTNCFSNGLKICEIY